jgi:hypothetical protein
MGWLLKFVSNIVLPAAAALLVVALVLCAIVLVVQPAHGAEGGASGGAQWNPPEAKLRDWGTAKWTTENTMLQAAVTGLALVAAEQTVQCMRLEFCYEKGVLSSALYGERQTVNEVWKFAALRSLGLWALSYYGFDNPERVYGQWVMLAVGGLDIRHNQREGLPPDWRWLGGSLGLGLVFRQSF